MGLREVLAVAGVLILNLLVLLTFPKDMPDPPKQAIVPLTGFPAWHGEKHDEFPEQERAHGILTMLVTFISSYFALKFTAKSLTDSSSHNSYFYFKDNAPIPTTLFNRLLALYNFSTFITSLAFFLFDAGKIFSMFGSLHNFFEVAIMLLLHRGGKVTSYLWYFGLLSVYFLLVQSLNIVFHWPYDAMWFKWQGLTQDFALLILFSRIYVYTKKNLKDDASTALPVTEDEQNNDDSPKLNLFPPVINHPREYLLMVMAVIIHVGGNILNTLSPTNATGARLPRFLGGSNYPIEDLDKIQPYTSDKVLSPRYDESSGGRKSDKVAVVIPMHLNEKKSKTRMKRLLEQLAWQTRVPNIVVVVDDCSPYHYKDSEILPDDYELDVKIEKLKARMGFAFARNRGIEIVSNYCSPSMILFTEDNCLPDVKWIECALEAYDTRKKQHGLENFLLCGQTRAIGNTLFDFYHNISGTLNGRFLPHHNNSLLYGTLVNFAAPFSVINRIRFDDSFNEGAFDDVEFFVRAREFEVKTWPVPDMFVNYNFGYSGGGSNDIKYFNSLSNVDGVLEEQEEEEEESVASWKSLVYFCRNYIMFVRLFRKYGVWYPLMLARHPEFAGFLELSQEISLI
ncbi:10312_t:CDS:2 [Ambispora gerdemannii]|uniref:10312_t:CDS:1 n=1 Tax=Ambispora gerdemannii TaxID=144530 RepID=A0A9N8YME2_9GLOM|nr:10312_t:CDS:2 [Ambispora gerdemannii]